MLLLLKNLDIRCLSSGFKVGWGLFVPSNKQYKQSQLPVIETLFVIIVNLSLCHHFFSSLYRSEILYKCKF